MSLPSTLPSSPSSNGGASPASAASPAMPPTPTSGLQPMTLPEVSMPSIAAAANAAQTKRKPSRRANTAERRATHNAVERQRRENLNGRFLDLAALLPNLTQIRRPSKSAIVNSSIAHIHASRRHRMLAARELRHAKLEADALRREINQWRDRAGLPQVEEPVRSDAFNLILSGDLELEAELLEHAHGHYGGSMEEDGYEGPFDEGDEDYAPMPPHGGNVMVSPTGFVDEDPMAAVAMYKQNGQNPFAHNVPQPPQLAIRPPPPQQQQQHVGASPLSAHPMSAHAFAPSPTGIHFDGTPSSLQFDSQRLLPPGHPAHFPQVAPQHFVGLGDMGFDGSKMGAWSGDFNAGGMYPNASNYGMMMQQLMKQGHVFGSPVDGDDGSSVSSAPGSSHGARPRSNSGASYGNGAGGVSTSFEVPSLLQSAPSARSRGLSISTGSSAGGAPPAWDMKSNPIQIPVGAGFGAGTAFAMMM